MALRGSSSEHGSIWSKGYFARNSTEAETLRTGPLVRRGANVSRAGQAAVSMPRMLPRAFGRQNPPLTHFPLPPILPKREVRSSCRLPINLRSFLAEQLGCQAEADDETILSFAAYADQSTLNRLARAIRRYSTARAHEAWSECSVAVAKLADAYQHYRPVVLCLRCAQLDFGDAALHDHQRNRCLSITLTPAETWESTNNRPQATPELIQRLVEQFRALRAAFGLPHFDLDCYLRGEQLTLMWRPLP